MAKSIAEKSPVAVATTKISRLYSRDKSVTEGLDHIAILNSVMLQSEDLEKAAMASLTKKKAQFAKL